MPDKPTIIIPLVEDLDEVARKVLNIPDSRVGLFSETVLGIAHTLSDYRARGISPNDAIRRTRKALVAAKKGLQRASAAVSAEQHLLTHFLDSGLSDELAALFSINGMERLTGQHTGFALDEKAIQIAIDRSHGGGTVWILEELQRVAQHLMAENPATPLVKLFQVLANHLEDQIVILGHAPRGQPKNQERQFVLSRLSMAHPNIFGTKPTTTPCGKFCLMCELVFESIALDATGLDTAIGRHLAASSKS